MLEGELKGDIWILTETWLTSEEAELGHGVAGFRHLFSCRNSKEEHGGVSVYVREGIKCRVLEIARHPEIVALSIGDMDLLVTAVYASPRQANKDIDVFGELSNMIARIPAHRCVLIMGDLNARIGTLQRTSGPFDPHDPLGLSERGRLEGLALHSRRSQDRGVNTRGRECIQFCDTFYMDILNGCVDGDRHGACTYYSNPIVGERGAGAQ